MNPEDIFINTKESWVPFEVMRMRYEEKFSHLTENEISEFRKSQARFAYLTLDKHFVPLYEREQTAVKKHSYVVIKFDEHFYLCLKKSKTSNQKISDLEEQILLRKQSKVKWNYFYIDVSINKKSKNGKVKISLSEENDEKIEEIIINNIKLEASDKKIAIILYAINECLKLALNKNMKNVSIRTHHNAASRSIKRIHRLNFEHFPQTLKPFYIDIKRDISSLSKFRYAVVPNSNKKRVKSKTKEVKDSLSENLLQRPNTNTAYVDVSCLPDHQKSYLAGVMYDKKGCKLFDFHKEVEFSMNTFHLETLAVLEMLKEAKNNHLNEGIIYTDNYESFRFIKNLKKVKNKDRELYRQIQNEFQNNHGFDVCHINRKHNKEAHHLSRIKIAEMV
jgi:ribonuclease HI